jgi:hypothetical protein
MLRFNNLTLKNYLFNQQKIKTYAIVDLSQDDNIWLQITTIFDVNYEILLKDCDMQELEYVAPYIVEIEEDSEFYQWLITEGYGKNWMIFFQSNEHISTLKSHFLDFFYQLIEIEENNTIYYKEGYVAFYDPRVFQGYIKALNLNELIKFFDGIESFLCENILDKTQLLRYQLNTFNNQITADKINIVT